MKPEHTANEYKLEDLVRLDIYLTEVVIEKLMNTTCIIKRNRKVYISLIFEMLAF